MLYLEDYLELIEQLPNEFKSRFAKIREMDLQVQNDIDSLDTKVKDFFQNGRKAKSERKQSDYLDINGTYLNTIEVADEKIVIVRELQELLQRYTKRLVHELEKFKIELEADNPGITDQLEKHSFELDHCCSPHTNSTIADMRFHQVSTAGQKRKRDTESTISKYNGILGISSKNSPSISNIAKPANDISNFSTLQSKVYTKASSPRGSVPYKLNSVSGCNNAAVEAAAFQALSTTKQMQQGMKLGIKASLLIQSCNSLDQKAKSTLHKGSQELAEDGSVASKSHECFQVLNKESTKQLAKRKVQQKYVSSVDNGYNSAITSTPLVVDSTHNTEVNDEVSERPTTLEISEYVVDPDEPRYCICNQISYGEMVGCDNDDCPIEWFHYACVGISEPPKGKWYCPQCTVSMKRRSARSGHK
ncbi:Inhibitor of growth protein 3 [Trichoplax sp. H2]|nr:Inhibitor of growth protein 3 [Trichoplax sp. H2]|eukprot:RDD47214.1 Inhibitor of growth protein 3 [Trichoplax sp. H2]